MIRKNASPLAALGLVGALSAACASITASRTETISVNSYPEGAEVRLDGMPRGSTPTSLEVEKTRPPRIHVAAPGYRPEECRLRTSPGTGYVIADVALCVLLFPFGCISFIDAGGAWNEFDSTSCNVGLQRQPESVQVYPPQTQRP